MTKNNAAQPGLTESALEDLEKQVQRDIPRFGPNVHIGVRAGLLRDMLSKLRAPVADRQRLRELVDVVWNEATESTAVPDTPWADRLIDKVFPSLPASAPVAGEATYYAVMHGQALFGVFETETAANECIEKSLHPGVMSIRPLYAAPQASEEVRDADHPVFAFLLGEGPLRGVHFGERAPGAIGKWWWRQELRAALSAQPGAQRTGGSDAK